MNQFEGRTGSFAGGAESMRFHTMAAAKDQVWKPQSVLDQQMVFASPNGQSAADRARSPLKGRTHSVNGESRSTYDARMWTSPTPYRTYG